MFLLLLFFLLLLLLLTFAFSASARRADFRFFAQLPRKRA
jgi:hypothetical protein